MPLVSQGYDTACISIMLQYYNLFLCQAKLCSSSSSGSCKHMHKWSKELHVHVHQAPQNLWPM